MTVEKTVLRVFEDLLQIWTKLSVLNNKVFSLSEGEPQQLEKAPIQVKVMGSERIHHSSDTIAIQPCHCVDGAGRTAQAKMASIEVCIT